MTALYRKPESAPSRDSRRLRKFESLRRAGLQAVPTARLRLECQELAEESPSGPLRRGC